MHAPMLYNNMTGFAIGQQQQQQQTPQLPVYWTHPTPPQLAPYHPSMVGQYQYPSYASFQGGMMPPNAYVPLTMPPPPSVIQPKVNEEEDGDTVYYEY
jgi:hypothetical protein